VVVSWGERSVRGELVVTRAGLEGGPVYALSGPVGRENRFPTFLVLDLAPDLDTPALAERLSRRRAKESQSTWLRGAGLERVVIGLLREATGNRIPDDPAELAALVKAAPFEVRRLASIDRAISTAGGVVFDALDDDLMLRSRPGVFLAGEMLDWDAPTGGYLLQACFSTGRRAGAAAAAFVGLGG
jgi:predicted flavoprotein YhiN